MSTNQDIIGIVKELQDRWEGNSPSADLLEWRMDLSVAFPAIAQALFDRDEKLKVATGALESATADLRLANTTVGKADLGSRGQTKACMRAAQHTLIDALFKIRSLPPL